MAPIVPESENGTPMQETMAAPAAEERALGRGGITRAATVFGLGTAVSRVAGLVYQMLAARIFGTSLAMSAFVLAWAIPNLFRRLFAEGRSPAHSCRSSPSSSGTRAGTRRCGWRARWPRPWALC